MSALNEYETQPKLKGDGSEWTACELGQRLEDDVAAKDEEYGECLRGSAMYPGWFEISSLFA